MPAPKLDIRHLGMLRAIADTKNVTRAADLLGVTQSALSHRIREAERRVGTPLFGRSGNRLYLTPAGERLHNTAMFVLDDLQRAEADVRVLAEQQRTVVRLGQGTYNRFHWYPDFVRTLDEPDIELDIVARAAQEPLDCLLDASADVVMVHGVEQEKRRLRWFRLANDPRVAIMAPSHALAEKRWLVPEDFTNERYITYAIEPTPGFEWDRLFRAARVQPRRVSAVGTPEAIIDLVRAGFGISILSQWAVQPEIQDGTLAARPLGRHGMDLNWWVVIRADEPDDGPAARVARALADWSRMRQQGNTQVGFEPTTNA